MVLMVCLTVVGHKTSRLSQKWILKKVHLGRNDMVLAFLEIFNQDSENKLCNFPHSQLKSQTTQEISEAHSLFRPMFSWDVKLLKNYWRHLKRID